MLIEILKNGNIQIVEKSFNKYLRVNILTQESIRRTLSSSRSMI